MMAAGLSAEEVALHGRWKSAKMPLRYKHNSVEYKFSILVCLVSAEKQ